VQLTFYNDTDVKFVFPEIRTSFIKFEFDFESFCRTDISCALDRLQSLCTQHDTEQTANVITDYTTHGCGSVNTCTATARQADTGGQVGLDLPLYAQLCRDVSQTVRPMYLMFVYPLATMLSHVPTQTVTQLKMTDQPVPV